MTCFNTRQEARTSLLVRAHALNGQRRHVNQQSSRNIWFDAEFVKACMWRKESDPLPEEYEELYSWAAGLTMDMYEEDYRDLPRSTRLERKAAKSIDQLKCGCARTWLALGLGFGLGFGFGFGFGAGSGQGKHPAPRRAASTRRGSTRSWNAKCSGLGARLVKVAPHSKKSPLQRRPTSSFGMLKVTTWRLSRCERDTRAR